tara:strand:- start:121 stop:672 length:552 start_codon:yes stop_codon:yes gene_type:complete
MGLRLHVDLETNRGPTNELYVRIDSWKINMTVNEVKFTTTSWLDKSYGDRFLRKYFTDALQPAVGLVGGKVIYYDVPSSDGEEIVIDNLYIAPMFIEKEVTEDVLEERIIKKEVPYVSFDENGDEVTLYRTVDVPEKIKVGTESEIQKVVDYTIVDRLREFSYDYLAEELAKVFPKDKIEKLY